MRILHNMTGESIWGRLPAGCPVAVSFPAVGFVQNVIQTLK